MSEVAPAFPLKDYTTYLAARKELIAARTGFFDALRAYLQPEQRPDAQLLGDSLDGAACRTIPEDSWVMNPARGYVTVLEAPANGRPFRLSVLQQGNELRVGVRFDRPTTATSHEGEQRLLVTFAGVSPVRKRLTNGLLMLDWHFQANDLYRDAQAFEDAVFKVGSVFESALQALASPARTTTA